MTDTALDDLLKESSNYAGGEPPQKLREVSGAFLRQSAANPAILRAAAGALPTLPPAGAGWLALVLGAAVEGGRDPALATPALVQFMRSWLPRLPVPEITQDEEGEDEELFPDPTSEQQELLDALRPICQSLVAHLACMPGERQRLAADEALVERLGQLGGYTPGLNWVRETLLRMSGTLIVLHPPSSSGLKLRYENVANNFHLFSLVQAAVGTRLPGGREPDPKIAAAARGQTHDDLRDHAWWHYGNPRSKTPDLHQSIWGEGLLTEIPVINGSRVMLLWPPILQSRAWGSGFFSPHLAALPANVVLAEELSHESALEWLQALGIP